MARDFMWPKDKKLFFLITIFMMNQIWYSFFQLFPRVRWLNICYVRPISKPPPPKNYRVPNAALELMGTLAMLYRNHT